VSLVIVAETVKCREAVSSKERQRSRESERVVQGIILQRYVGGKVLLQAGAGSGFTLIELYTSALSLSSELGISRRMAAASLYDSDGR
jgi:hypothetical protein